MSQTRKPRQAKNREKQFDVIITGGGLVGASLACALGNQSLSIALLESHPIRTGTAPAYDDRAIALSYGTSQIFRSMGLWHKISEHVTPIKSIHVSDKGHFGCTRINAEEEKVDALGYVITARQLGNLLYDYLRDFKNITLICPATLTGLVVNENDTTATIEQDQSSLEINTSLVVAADGGNSSIRKLLGISSENTDYRQSALTANISLSKPHNNIAYERFTEKGPIALLPMQDNVCSLVWTHDTDAMDAVLSLTDETFLTELQKQFGLRAGKFIKVGKRNGYPLKLIKVNEQVRARTVLIGNAAHTLHPIAGQGFNLGMRDVATLAQIIVDGHKDNVDIGASSLLEPYLSWRRRDQRTIIHLTDNLVRVFSNRFPPLAAARNLAMLATDVLPPVKHILARHTMGIAGRLPRLARGLPL